MSDPQARSPAPNGPAKSLLVLIGAYQRWISPFLGSRCRFHPSCSAYAKMAIETHGALRGSWLALRLEGKELPEGLDLVVVARPSVAGASYREIAGDIRDVLNAAGLRGGDGG